jgi:hypothetical protein
MAKILVGADPELFMRNPNTGAFVSAHDAVPGTKYEPFKVPNGAIQVDGTALEFNIDPAGSVDEFVHNIKSVRATLESYVPGYNVVAEPVASYDADYFNWEVPSSAHTLGCDPDYNGWTGDQNPRPDPDGKPIRTASGHVHIGWSDNLDVYDSQHFKDCCRIARQMDYYLGIHSLQWDPDPTRRLLYGKAGAFRVKPYGMEYRVLSNRWLDKDSLIAWVYDAVQAGMNDFMSDNIAEDKFGALAQEIIDNNVLDWQVRYPELKIPVKKVA